MGVATGTRTTQVSLSPVGVLNNIRVDWGADVPEGTSLTIETRYSFDNGTSWSEWQVVDNGEIIITDHTGIDVSNGLLESRQTMTATNVDETPSLNFLKFRCNIRPAQNGARWTIDGLTDVQNMLSSEGTLIFNWVPEFHQSDLTDGNHNLLTFSDEVDNGVYVDGDGNLQVSDGTNITSHTIHWVKNQVVKIAITFSGSSAAIKTDLGNGVLTSSTGIFDGGIPSGDDLRIFYRNLYPQWMQSISMYGVVLDDATILEEMGKYSAETDLTDDELADDRLVEYLGQAPHNLHKNLVCYLPLDGSLSDVISGSSVSCVRDGELVRLTDKGVYEAAPADTPAMGKYGVFHDGAGTQYFVNPHDPVTQSINLSVVGNYCLSVSGTGSATVAAGTATIDLGGEATDGNYVVFEVTGTGTVDVTVSGELEWCQLENGTFPSSRIYNDGIIGDGSTSSRSAQTADSSGNGLSIPLADLDPKLIACLGGDGAPLGSELVVNGDFSDWSDDDPDDFDIDFTEDGDNFVTEYNDGCRFVSDGSLVNIKQSIGWEIGKTYKIFGEISDYVKGAVVIAEEGEAAIANISSAGAFSTTHIVKDSSNRIELYRKSGEATDITLDNISIRELQPSGTLLFHWRPEFDYDSVPPGEYGLITFNDETKTFIYIDSIGNIIASDGINTIGRLIKWAKGDDVNIVIRYQNETMELGTSVNGGDMTFTPTSFKGQIPTKDNLKLYYDFEFPSWME